MLFGALLLLWCPAMGEAAVQGPPGPSNLKHTATDNTAIACDDCTWTSTTGVHYDMSTLCENEYTLKMDKPRGAQIHVGVCRTVTCGNSMNSRACIFVPGNDATSSGRIVSMQALDPNIPAAGIRLLLRDGDYCSAVNKPRQTVINIKCGRGVEHDVRGWEGEGSDICTYYVTLFSPHACPTHNMYTQPLPQITAVSGCTDSVSKLSTSQCPPQGGNVLTLHGLGFHDEMEVWLGDLPCDNVVIVDSWSMTCILPAGSGEGLIITYTIQAQQSSAVSSTCTLSFKASTDYQHQFTKFVDLGVGGLGKQIKELYQRAFASRGVPMNVLKQLGIEHAKGILLYGPPGSGKTLLAKTIAKILNTEQVQLINAPEIMSKFLGESEKNLRGHFEEAVKAWNDHGEASDLHVIIIDEIDAICKHRGKSDLSAAAAAYDSVVNQLLTMMDGLKELPNVLVIGMTNRKELLDPALLRPGRLEIHIEIGLPDQQGRWEILNIHTRSMQEHHLLAVDVNLRELAARTSQYSGAQLAGMVRLAASIALDRAYATDPAQTLLITRQDFQHALFDTQPVNTQQHALINEKLVPRGIINCGKIHQTILMDIFNLADQLRQSQFSSIQAVLLHGPKGTGKTGLTGHIAVTANFTFIRVISPSQFLHHTNTAKFDMLTETFIAAFESEYSLVILDDLDLFLEVVEIGGNVHASISLLNQLGVVFASSSAKCRILVIATIQSGDAKLEAWPAGKIGLQQLFTQQHYVAPLDSTSVIVALSSLNITIPVNVPSMFKIPLKKLLSVSDCMKQNVLADVTAVWLDCLNKWNWPYAAISSVAVND